MVAIRQQNGLISGEGQTERDKQVRGKSHIPLIAVLKGGTHSPIKNSVPLLKFFFSKKDPK